MYKGKHVIIVQYLRYKETVRVYEIEKGGTKRQKEGLPRT